MFIKRALVLSKDKKTDEELKTVMATHPWAPKCIYGFYSPVSGEWGYLPHHFCPDAIWIDQEIVPFRKQKWLVESFDTPGCPTFPHVLVDDEPDLGPYWRPLEQKWKLEREWWRATVAVVLHCVPDEYWAHEVYYGEIEDEFKDGEAKKAWHRQILHEFNYSDEVKTAINAEL